VEPGFPEGYPAPDEAFKTDGLPKTRLFDPLKTSNPTASLARRIHTSHRHLLRGSDPSCFSWGNAQVTIMPAPPELG
jgi:hypothetical protein